MIWKNLSRTYIIAEIGVNHNGSVELAKKMIVEAKRCGADAVKFQTFTAQSLVGKNVPKVKYQKETTDKDETHYEMIRLLELSQESHHQLWKICQTEGIDFLSTPYDIESAKFLVGLGVRSLKIASADIVDLNLLEFAAESKIPTILSTGMATLGEIESAYHIFEKFGAHDGLCLLHCVSNYPCKEQNLNLRVINTLRSSFACEVGFSDHAQSSLAAFAAVCLGAKVIEKHFTLDKNMSGPDHRASADPKEFKNYCEQIRLAELMLGNPIKKIQEEEKEMRLISRKSMTFSRDMQVGHIFTANDFVLKRPGTGLPASLFELLKGRKLKKDASGNDLVALEYFNFKDDEQ
jgi:N,N'-diacetyllegionaminate synthase